jgi:hypothetical protein
MGGKLMPKQSFVWDGEAMTFRPRDEFMREKALAAAAERSTLPSPMVIRDNIGGIRGLVHPATGERYDSKSRFRDETRARGLTEMGNEAFPVRQGPTEAETRQEIQREIAEAYTAIEQGAEVAPAKIANEQIIKPELARAADAAI